MKKYLFKLNNKSISRDELSRLCLESDQLEELIDTGSVTCERLTDESSVDIVTIELLPVVETKEIKLLNLYKELAILSGAAFDTTNTDPRHIDLLKKIKELENSWKNL